jgi:hypothetical protein
LRQPEAWLRLHQQGWTRNIIPPANSSYMVQVEHLDGAATEVFYFRACDPKSTLRITVKVDDSMLVGCICLSQRSMI